jgi:dihydrofolate reductase
MITLIAAIAANGAIGKDNKLLWRISEDLKRFKRITSNHAIIMGRKTFESLGKPLKNRTNIVITKNPNYQVPTEVLVAHSLEESIDIAHKIDSNPFVIGGSKIYKEALKYADFLDITHVKKEFEGDVFFPEIDPSIWQIITEGAFFKDEESRLSYNVVKYSKK